MLAEPEWWGLTGTVEGAMDDGNTTVREVVEMWGQQLQDPHQHFMGITVTKDVAEQILARRSHCLFALARWLSMSTSAFYAEHRVPDPDWAQESAGKHQEVLPVDALTASAVLQLLQHLRMIWAETGRVHEELVMRSM